MNVFNFELQKTPLAKAAFQSTAITRSWYFEDHKAWYIFRISTTLNAECLFYRLAEHAEKAQTGSNHFQSIMYLFRWKQSWISIQPEALLRLSNRKDLQCCHFHVSSFKLTKWEWKNLLGHRITVLREKRLFWQNLQQNKARHPSRCGTQTLIWTSCFSNISSDVRRHNDSRLF